MENYFIRLTYQHDQSYEHEAKGLAKKGEFYFLKASITACS